MAGFIGKESIGAASERSHLHTLDIVVLHGCPFHGFQYPVYVSPLRKNVRVVCFDVCVAYYIVCKYIDTHACRHVRQFVLYQRVGVVGAACQQDGKAVFFAAVLQYLSVVGCHVVAEILLRGYGFPECLFAGRGVYAELFQVGFTLFKQQVFVFKCNGGRIDGDAAALYAFYHLCISRNDGAVVAVLSAVHVFEYYGRHEYPFRFPVYQVLDVAVYQLGGETDVVRHYQTGFSFVSGVCRGR